MNIFNFNTSEKHLKQFEIKIAELLNNDFPELKKVLEISKLDKIYFTENPKGIYLCRKSYMPNEYAD
ncbi:hypothetical protein, partial [Flavobacterium sp.]|uniref:hypothetical protein n=1 Tax=Flavobacterium sp. TaxID=239 RepID=UPI000EE12FB8